MIVGHNPGMTDLANQLLPSIRLHNLPTCGVVAIDVNTDTWAKIPEADAILFFYDYPKNPELLLIED